MCMCKYSTSVRIVVLTLCNIDDTYITGMQLVYIISAVTLGENTWIPVSV